MNFLELYSVRNTSLGRKCHDTFSLHPVKDASLQDAGFREVMFILPSDTFLTECR